MRKIISLDVGTKTIGVAKCFADTQMVFPVCTLKRKSVKKDSIQIAEICKSELPSLIVVGLPLLADGTEGRMARLARQIGVAVGGLNQIPVVYQDESDSSLEAQERLNRSSKSSRAHKDVIDQEAAIVILERWLREGEAR